MNALCNTGIIFLFILSTNALANEQIKEAMKERWDTIRNSEKFKQMEQKMKENGYATFEDRKAAREECMSNGDNSRDCVRAALINKGFKVPELPSEEQKAKMEERWLALRDCLKSKVENQQEASREEVQACFDTHGVKPVNAAEANQEQSVAEQSVEGEQVNGSSLGSVEAQQTNIDGQVVSAL